MDSKRQCLIPESCKAKGLGLCRSCKIKALNSDPEFAAKRNAKSSARMKALNLDPEFAAKRDARMKALHSDPEFAAKRDARGSARMKALNLDPEFAAKRKLRDAKRLDTLKKRRLEKGI
jgi:hypothetical protein